MRLQPGELVGSKYRVVRLIGDGGMGSVYEARHELLGAPVALKFLHADLAQRPGLAARFLQEARVSATIQSPHVTRVTDVDTTREGSPYLVMELLTGESLQSLLDRVRQLSESQAIDFALQTLAGLEAAHALGVVHRDLKPDNVFVTPTSGGPLLKLIDFGIAKLRETSEYKKGLTRAGVVMGTAEYMAPEQLYAASEVDHRADIYSLGVMLFEMLSGSRPADGDSAEAIVAKVLSGDVQRLAALVPGIRPGLVPIVERALAPDRENRFASAYEMRAALAEQASELSHAGRLAANSAPLAPSVERAPLTFAKPQDAGGVGGQSDTAMAPPPGQVPDTLDAPVPVASTLPEPPEASPKGVTQAASPPYFPQPTAPHVSRRRRRPRRWWMALLALVVLAGASVVVARVIERERRQGPQNIPAFTNSPEPSPEIEPIVIPTPADLPTTTPAQPPVVRTPTQTPRAPNTDSGTNNNTAGAPAIQPLPFPSFALPSSLPPLPSTFPGLPTALPSFFPSIPGLTPPRAPSTADAGAPGP